MKLELISSGESMIKSRSGMVKRISMTSEDAFKLKKDLLSLTCTENMLSIQRRSRIFTKLL